MGQIKSISQSHTDLLAQDRSFAGTRDLSRPQIKLAEQ